MWQDSVYFTLTVSMGLKRRTNKQSTPELYQLSDPNVTWTVQIDSPEV